MTPDNARFLIGALLIVHGLGHGGAIGALVWVRLNPGTATGGWLAAKSWLFPALQTPAATNIAMAFWAFAMLGFLVAALSFLGIAVPAHLWRPIAVGSSLVSLAGMLIFYGTWPVFNTLASLAVNLGVLVTQLVTRWPPQEMLGR
jgi:hypothetical protein